MNETLRLYRDRVLEKNRFLNLTAITDKEEFDQKNINDSLKLLEFHCFMPGEKVLDLGTGAGLPGIPLAIMVPDIQVTLVDARQKKIKFLQELLTELDLSNVKAIAARAEELGRNPIYRESFDTVVTRALAPLNVLLEYSIPLLRRGGLLFAYKGPKGEEELRQAKKALKLLKTTHMHTHSYQLSEAQLSLMVFQKEGDTPKMYPRTSGTPSKKPL